MAIVEDMLTRLRVIGASAYVGDMGRAETAVEKVGRASKTSGAQQQAMGRQAQAASGRMGKLGGSVKGFVGGLAGGFAATQVMKDSINNAVDLGEEINKTAVVFRGPGSKAILDWSKNSATALGISRQAALSAAGTFGNMLVPMGFARQRAGEMSKNMVNLAGDMASFNNASPEEVLEALRSGLAGETEPLRRFGVFLSDARLKQQAMNMGLYHGKGNLTASAKAAATYAVVLKDTKDAQGDFHRTSSSLANQQRVLRAQYANITAQLGKQLIPVLSFLVTHLKEVAAVLGVLAAAWSIGKIVQFISMVSMLANTTRGLMVVLRLTAAAQWIMNAAMLAFPAVAIIAGIVAIGAAFVIAYRKVGWFRRGVNAVWSFIKNHWPLLVGIIAGPIGVAVLLAIRHFDKIKGAVSAVIGWVKKIPGAVSTAFHGAVRAAESVARGFVNVGKQILEAIKQGITSAPSALLDAIKGLLPGGLAGKVGGALGLWQHGGVVPNTQWGIVGERGPELLQLPGGSRITPLPNPRTVGGAKLGAAGAAGGAQTTAHFYLDRRLIATAVAQDTADRKARR